MRQVSSPHGGRAQRTRSAVFFVHVLACTALSFAVGACSAELEAPGTSSGAGGGPGVPPPAPPPPSSVQSEVGPTLAQLAQVGDQVATLELSLPDVSPFLLRATLPVPRQTFVAGQATSPFRVVGPTGVESNTQIEVVTRYPASHDGADVIEIQARVEKPSGAAIGSRARWTVVYDPHPIGACVPGAYVSALLDTPNAMTLRMRDVFGNVYTADLYEDARPGAPLGSVDSTRELKRGRISAQTATHEVLRPVSPQSGAQGTLPHGLGVHSYVTRFTSEDFLTLDLRVHNGFSGREASSPDDDPLGKVYFDSIELLVPSGWSVLSAFADPALGAAYDEGSSRVIPLVAPQSGNKLHAMPAMAQMQRRLALARSTPNIARARTVLDEQGLAFARDGVRPNGKSNFSWWNEDTGRYFAQRHALPSLSSLGEGTLRTTLAGQLAQYTQQLATGGAGQFPVEATRMGWAHPWGIAPGGMVSGAEIYLFDGVDVAQAGSREGYKLAQLRHRMSTDRQPNVMFDRDGRHTRVEDWVVHAAGGDYLPIWWFNAPMLWASDPFGYAAAPTFQRTAVAASQRNPAYESLLDSYQPIDWQHLVRYTRNAKVLAWLGNDALAKDDLTAQAEGFRFGYSLYPQDLYQNIIPTGMLALSKYVDAHPGYGVAFGRGEAWGLDAVLCAYSFADDDWREEVFPWCETLVDLLERGQSDCTGILQATPQYNVFGSLYRCRQSIEAAITENALVALRETVFLGEAPARVTQLDQVLRRSFYAMVSDLVWSEADHGPWAMMAVGPFNAAQPPYCSSIPSDGNYGFADHYQPWSSFAYAWEITHDELFLEKAAEMMGGTPSEGLASDPGHNWQNKAALTALAQRLATTSP